MNVKYHPAVANDVAEALQRYNLVSEKLGAEFKEEFRQVIALAAKTPTRFRPINTKFRRANLKRFPYHFLYRQLPDGIRITLVRHHRHHPEFGMERV